MFFVPSMLCLTENSQMLMEDTGSAIYKYCADFSHNHTGLGVTTSASVKTNAVRFETRTVPCFSRYIQYNIKVANVLVIHTKHKTF